MNLSFFNPVGFIWLVMVLVLIESVLFNRFDLFQLKLFSVSFFLMHLIQNFSNFFPKSKPVQKIGPVESRWASSINELEKNEGGK